jgi:hypothetical protein
MLALEPPDYQMKHCARYERGGYTDQQPAQLGAAVVKLCSVAKLFTVTVRTQLLG